MKYPKNHLLGPSFALKTQTRNATVEKNKKGMFSDMNPIECKDGTIILSNIEEVNEHLKNGWALIEVGALISKSISPVHLIKFGFRL